MITTFEVGSRKAEMGSIGRGGKNENGLEGHQRRNVNVQTESCFGHLVLEFRICLAAGRQVCDLLLDISYLIVIWCLSFGAFLWVKCVLVYKCVVSCSR